MLQTWMWLSEGLGYGAPNTKQLLEAYPGGAEDVLQDVASLPGSGLVTKGQAHRLANTRPEEYEITLQKMREKGIVGIAYPEAEYPGQLRNIHNPPLVLYIQGNAALLNGYLYIGVVGARNPSAYGVEAVQKIGQGLASAGAVIVSGLASGLDAEAHKAALAVGAPTITCIAFGHNHCYPAGNRGLMEIIARYGVVVSEYQPDVKPEKPYFLQRNRMIAGLSHGILVAEAKRHSGTMSTVNFATEWGRDVFAVPGSVFSQLSAGTNAMIKEGAILAATADDVLEQYVGPDEADALKEQREPDVAKELEPPGQQETLAMVSGEAQQVFGHLGTTPQGLEAICTACGLAAGRVMAALTELELAGLSRQLAGRQFTINC